MDTTNKKYFAIGEVAEMLGVNTSLIRFWESEFESLNFKKNRNGNRRLTAENIDELRLIFQLIKVEGYTIEGAKEVLKKSSYKARYKLKAIETLEKVKSFLHQLKEELPS